MTKDEALKLAAYGLEIILSSFEKDGKFVMKSMIRNELFDEVNLLLRKSKKVSAKPMQPADLHNRLADLHLYEEVAEHYAKCAISPEALRDWVAERVNTQTDERNFCPRCGKRTADLTAIHTCTPPPQRQWVGLTDEERSDIAAQGHQRWKEYAEAIEAKLKDKNT